MSFNVGGTGGSFLMHQDYSQDRQRTSSNLVDNLNGLKTARDWRQPAGLEPGPLSDRSGHRPTRSLSRKIDNLRTNF